MNSGHIHIRDDGFTIQFHRPFHPGRWRSRRREQRLDKPPGLVGIQLNPAVLMDDPASHFTDMHDDKRGHGAALNRGRFLEKLLVRRGDPGDEAPAFRLFQCCRHALNVCLRGTQIKN